VNIPEQRATIGAALEAVVGRVYLGKTSLYPVAPCAVVDIDSFAPVSTWGDDGLRQSQWVVKLFAPIANQAAAVDTMDEWLSPDGELFDALVTIVGISSPEGRNLNQFALGAEGSVAYLTSEIAFVLL
jgi:hypothetical protein